MEESTKKELPAAESPSAAEGSPTSPPESDDVTAESADGKQAPRSSIVREIKTLRELIPDADIRRLDDEGWQQLTEGESLLVCYLASERRKADAEIVNRRNEAASLGAVSGGFKAGYTIDEIRRMDRGTVRQNLDKVLRSLEANKGR